MKDDNKKLKKLDKKQIEIQAKYIIQRNLKFAKKYAGLYDKLYNRFNIEFVNIQSLENKCDFLQELIDKIIEANHDMKYNYNISDLEEESESELKGLLNFFEAEMQNLFRMNDDDVKKSDVDMLWFKAGLCFAKGEMEKYQLNETIHPDWTAPKIAKEMNLPECEKYFLATLNNYVKNSNSNKNIFNSLNRMEKLIKHCQDNKFTVSENFISRYNLIKEKKN